ncbi:MAG: tetraacyldisaccharide 4'-kinase [Rubrivivax sp.]|nr:tetraacyldisaccharide 4'-kinase [Rubrivivax sp.]
MTVGLEALLSRLWWQPQRRLGAWLLWPLSLLYRALRAVHERLRPPATALPVPVLVVGNWVVGGAGKTPTVMAVVQALRAAGHLPGVVSRGHGRESTAVRAVLAGDTPAEVGDEPLLIHRRCQVPVWVGRQRVQAALALCQAHPEVDVLVADDGLQHHALARQAELVVFDERGAGNGLLLPAGPLREPLPEQLPGHCRVLYTAGLRSTGLPGALAVRTIRQAWPLSTWSADTPAAKDGQPLSALQGRPLLAAAGIAAPEKFFGMLQAAGLDVERLPLPDHHPYTTLPWPAGAQEIVTTEKDAIKLAGRDLGGRRVWVVPLDLQLPATLVGELLDLLFPHAGHEPEAKP